MKNIFACICVSLLLLACDGRGDTDIRFDTNPQDYTAFLEANPIKSYTEAWLMLGIDALSEEARAKLLQSHWRLCALLIHTYNIKHGLKCTGFDEDDPEFNLEESKEGI